MKLTEFESRFQDLWNEQYALYNPDINHWSRKRLDDIVRQNLREMLLDYARSSREVAISRREKNTPHRIFQQLGIDPSELDVDGYDCEENLDGLNGSDDRSGQVLYIERKAGSVTGEARIGRITRSKSGRTLYYRCGGQSFRHLIT